MLYCISNCIKNYIKQKINSMSRKIVINTSGYGTGEGFADQITLPNGKFLYTGIASVNSVTAKELGWEVKPVRYFGACAYHNINDRAHMKYPIQIDEVSAADFIGNIATDAEGAEAFKAAFAKEQK